MYSGCTHFGYTHNILVFLTILIFMLKHQPSWPLILDLSKGIVGLDLRWKLFSTKILASDWLI